MRPLPAAERRESPDTLPRLERFQRYRRQYLADGTGTPMSEMINLLAYGKYIALNTSNAGSVTWSRDKVTIFFHGLAIPLSAFRAMIHDSIRRTEDLLWKDLMLVRDDSKRWTVDLDALVAQHRRVRQQRRP